MKSITLESENCNSWNRREFENTSEYELECSSCSAYGSFSYVKKYFIWRWDINIPYDWKYGEWERIRLYPVQVPVVIIKCNLCGEIYRVYPSFILKGTTLTLTALIFVIFTYESSGLKWRNIPDKFCDKENKIAHSTLFKAVHGLGKSLEGCNKKVREAVEELTKQYQSPNIADESHPAWPPEKSRYEHTLAHEHALRAILFPLAYLRFRYDELSRLFFTYLFPLRIILSALSPPVSILSYR
ncbi:MAG TPA: hypothetical protein DDW17_02350 [Deltaproteobacteria bacterium]|nr:hypothetical protein [Deltaproteobacteria bacterium]